MVLLVLRRVAQRVGVVSSFARAAAAAASESASASASEGGLKLTLASPDLSLVSAAVVDRVIVPGRAGYFGVLANHVPTVAELQPGVVTVQKTDGSEDKYFVSSGFAVMEKDSTLTINALEAVPIAAIDKEAARKGLEDYEAKLASASSDEDKARAAIGVEVHKALVYAASL